MRVCLHKPSRIEGFLRTDPGLYLYLLGDLDDFFWPHTSWYGWQAPDDQALKALSLLYSGDELPVLLALGQPDDPAPGKLLESIKTLLPRRFYTHLTPGLESVLQADWALSGGDLHHRMLLTDPTLLADYDCPEAFVLSSEHEPAIQALYQAAYPHNWFNARMLATGQYLGVSEAESDSPRLLAVAGVHVYAPTLGIAALGNIAVHPDARSQGLSKRLTAALCRRLQAQLGDKALIGLNVHSANTPALRAYRRLGFEVCADYREWMAESIRL